MNSRPILETTTAYLRANQFGATENTPTPFVTISREAGAGASELALRLKELLDPASPTPWSIFDGNLITEMLQANQLPPRLAAFLPEARVSEIDAAIGEIVGLHPNLWTLTQKTDEFIRRLAASGHVIIVGRGGRFATADLAQGVHVRLIAPPAHRARIMAERHQVNELDAAEHNRESDRKRRRYVRSHFNATGPDPVHYDLVLNTARVPLGTAAALIAELVRVQAAVGAEATAPR